ncbi:MAG: DeoR/GlpR family DNA-binding transcription regulator [Lachnospiraceae bacterium]|nr:DeoR/GlpR family DNA-binding transcription regulator [Lachnospiraceae bacterium]
MIRAERFNSIISLSNEMDIVTLEALAKRLGVSVATVRRDVEELAAQGLVEKTRGGIIFCSKKQDSEPSLQLRSHINQEEKRRIAQAAFEYIRPDSFYMFDSGSTVGALIRLIPKNYPISIVTYDLSYINDLNNLECADVFILGGKLRTGQMACHGTFAENYLDQMNAHIAFIGADSVDLQKGIMGFNTNDVNLKQKMINNSDKTILLCDHSKFENRGFISIHGLEGIDLLITDSGTDPEVIERFREAGLNIQVV